MVLGCPSSLCLTPELQCTRGGTGVHQGGNWSTPEPREELRHNNPFRERIASSGDEVLSMNLSYE